MTRAYNIRFNKFDTSLRWLVEDAATLEVWPAESITIQPQSTTYHDDQRTLYFIQAIGVLVWSGQHATIKQSEER